MRLGALARTVARLAAAAALVTSAPADERQASGHRQSVGALDYPWSSVAKLYNSIGGACTAVVIDRMQVLTAAHCLYGRRTGRFLPPGSVHLLLGYERGDYRVHATRQELFAASRAEGGYAPVVGC